MSEEDSYHPIHLPYDEYWKYWAMMQETQARIEAQKNPYPYFQDFLSQDLLWESWEKHPEPKKSVEESPSQDPPESSSDSSSNTTD